MELDSESCSFSGLGLTLDLDLTVAGLDATLFKNRRNRSSCFSPWGEYLPKPADFQPLRGIQLAIVIV